MGKSSSKLIYVLLLFLLLTIAGAVFFYLEWEDPQIQLSRDIEMIPAHSTITATFTDMKSGIRSYQVTLVQDDHEYIIAQDEFLQKGTFEKKTDIKIVPAKLKLKDGPARFQIRVVDFSPLRNATSLIKDVTIDSVPPKVSLLSTSHYINPGGSCLVVYTASDDAVTSGVKFGDAFFPGHPTKIKEKSCYASYMAVPMDIDADTLITVVASDKAGNESTASVVFHLRRHVFRKDTVRVSKNFINSKAAQFQSRDTSLAGKSPLDVFIYLNETLRAANNQTIYELCQKTDSNRLWQGAFLRMKNAANKARFGDKRTYVFQGRNVGKSIHRGIDLASIRHATLQAANSGKILFAGDIGIYGNTVIIDHGQGLASLYAHMSAITVQEGQDIAKGAVIGKSGATGFAGGDHLHFSILINGIFVDPIEWWDSHWIHDNVELKLK